MPVCKGVRVVCECMCVRDSHKSFYTHPSAWGVCAVSSVLVHGGGLFSWNEPERGRRRVFACLSIIGSVAKRVY